MKVPRGAEEDGVEEAFFLEEPMRTVSTVGALLLFVVPFEGFREYQSLVTRSVISH